MTTGDAISRDHAAAPARVAGRYALGDLLGAGGMAVVRRGTDARLGRPVAVKMLRGELADAPAFQARFRREARAAAGLDHPSIVRVYDAGEEVVDGVVSSYIVMEYVEGQTLREWLLSGAADHGRALEITAQVLDALTTSHASGIVHRDIKPANVMVTPTGEVKVMDFGVARAVADVSASLTQTATVVGTAHYLSPEQARGDSVDARSDVYSTGCLLYELLAGRPPFVGDSAIAVAYQHVREEPLPPSVHEPSLPAEVDAVVMAALAKRPDERYQSADQMRRDILAVLAGGTVVTPVAAMHRTALLQAAGAAPEPPVATTQESPAVDATAAGATAGATGPAVTRHRRVRLLVAAGAALLVAAAGAFAVSGLNDPQVGQEADRGPGRSSQTDGRRTASEPESVQPVSDDAASTDDGTARTDRGGRDDGADVDDPRRLARQDTTDGSTDGPRPTPAPDTADSPTAEPSTDPTAADASPSESTPPDSPEPDPSEPSETPPPTTSTPGAAAEAPDA